MRWPRSPVCFECPSAGTHSSIPHASGGLHQAARGCTEAWDTKVCECGRRFLSQTSERGPCAGPVPPCGPRSCVSVCVCAGLSFLQALLAYLKGKVLQKAPPDFPREPLPPPICFLHSMYTSARVA